MKTISLKLPRRLEVQLSAAARRAGKSKSALVRDALEAFFEERPAARRNSCHELTRDLAGCIDGPGDLSWNKKRMRGYGK